ncbi:MAG: LytR/AlgR family response regulator transcription factor [Flavobacteriales bacterium]
MNSEKINAVLIDDSSQARKLLRLMLAELAPDVNVLGECSDLIEGVKSIRESKPDVVFLDIEMPGKSGLQILEELPRDEMQYEIIFTTAYDEYALRAFRLSALDYLLKPISETELNEAVKKIRQRKQMHSSSERIQALNANLQQKEASVICVPIQNGFARIPLESILYFEADGSYVNIVTAEGKPRTISKNLKYIEQTLEGNSRFLRVHRSYLLNIDQVLEYNRSGRGTILMNNGHSIDLARDRKEAFLKVFGT